MSERPLDLDGVQAFIHIAELGGFTRAAEAMGTTRAAVSLKLKRLEERLGCRLVERTPGYVQLSARGAAFLEHARELLEIHDRALAVFAGGRQRLTKGDIASRLRQSENGMRSRARSNAFPHGLQKDPCRGPPFRARTAPLVKRLVKPAQLLSSDVKRCQASSRVRLTESAGISAA